MSVGNIDEGSLHGRSSSNAGYQDAVFACIESDQHIRPMHRFPFLRINTPPSDFGNILTVYAAVAREHIRAAMRDYNALIFAYRQTGSGKTLTQRRLRLAGQRKKTIKARLSQTKRRQFSFWKLRSSRQSWMRRSPPRKWTK